MDTRAPAPMHRRRGRHAHLRGRMGRVGFTKAQLEAYRDAEVPDLVAPGLKLLFVGINPGLWTAATQTHFARPGNRFYPALQRGGVIDRRIDPSAGMTDDDRRYLIGRGIGISNLVRRATARADELTPAEMREGAARLARLVATHHPRVVAVAGITAYRAAFGVRSAVPGRQPGGLGGAEVWVVPNPSGLNAHDTVATLAEAYRAPAVAAGIDVTPTGRTGPACEAAITLDGPQRRQA